MAPVATRAFIRPRAYVRVKGPDAADLLQRIVSNDVQASAACEALLLTAKGRVIDPLLVWRRDENDFLLLTEPELGETVRAHLAKVRIAARCEIEVEEHTSSIVLGGTEGIPTADYGYPRSRCSTPHSAEPGGEELERLRILARTPRWGLEIDEGILPAEAGLDSRAISFTKGCYPGQEPLARLQNRGHAEPDAPRARHRLRAGTPRRRGQPRRPRRRPRHQRRARPRARLSARRGAGRRCRRGRRALGARSLTAVTLLPFPA